MSDLCPKEPLNLGSKQAANYDTFSLQINPIQWNDGRVEWQNILKHGMTEFPASSIYLNILSYCSDVRNL